MSRNTQSGVEPDLDPALHPDVEALSAFAEQALPDAEREAILAHAAGCGRCRQILFVAQEAAALPVPVSESSVLPFRLSKTRRIPITFSNWRFAGAATAAAIVLAAVSLLLLPKSTPPAQQAVRHEIPQPAAPLPQADSPQPQRPPLVFSKPAASPQPAVERSTRSALAEPKREILTFQDSSGMAEPAPPPATATSLEPAATPSSGAQPTLRANLPVDAAAQSSPGSVSETVTVEPLTTEESPQTPVAGTLGQQKIEAAPAPSPPQLQIALGASAQAIQTESAQTKPNQSGPESKQRSGGQGFGMSAKAGKSAGAAHGVGAGVSQTGSLPITGRNLAPLATIDGVSTEDARAEMDAARKALGAALPSGAPAVSTVAARHHLLAVDGAGALFLSDDSGKGWQPILQQWTGHAKELRLLPAPAAMPQASALATPSAPSAVFELITDAAAVWTSGDGKTWIAK